MTTIEKCPKCGSMFLARQWCAGTSGNCYHRGEAMHVRCEACQWRTTEKPLDAAEAVVAAAEHQITDECPAGALDKAVSK